MIRQLGNLFVLDTDKTTYAFAILPTGHPEHLYYGPKVKIDHEKEAMTIFEKRVCLPGNTVCYSPETPALGLEDVCLEMSSYGKGDIREPFVEVTHHDGSYTSDFLFESAELFEGKRELKTLPSSYALNTPCSGLALRLKDKQYNCTLELTYHVFEQMNVITRSSRLINTSDEEITLERLMSTQLDLSDDGWIFSSFHGAWAREMNRCDLPTGPVKITNQSYCGVSSNRSNPFVMLSRKETTEDCGECYGVNLVYSGNHAETVEVSAFLKTRLTAGINPASFQFHLAPNEEFEAPEAVMTYSNEGFNGMSRNMHQFVRNCIVRGVWKDKPRPVLLNSWEAAYFDINERKLLNLA